MKVLTLPKPLQSKKYNTQHRPYSYRISTIQTKGKMGYSARKWTYRLAEIYFSQEDADTFNNKMN
jgi:hypothetical protein